MVARILGSALNERVELRPIVCHALITLIEHGANKGILCVVHIIFRLLGCRFCYYAKFNNMLLLSDLQLRKCAYTLSSDSHMFHNIIHIML